MEAIREIVDLKKLGTIVNIPPDFNYSKVEILILPVDDTLPEKKKVFDPEKFYNVSSIDDVTEDIQAMRDEWDRI